MQLTKHLFVVVGQSAPEAQGAHHDRPAANICTYLVLQPVQIDKCTYILKSLSYVPRTALQYTGLIGMQRIGCKKWRRETKVK
jgi:hypothetical protein